MPPRLPAVLAVVALGGVIGSLARAGVAVLVSGVEAWPGAVATLAVNLVGAFAIGLVASRTSTASGAWWIRPFAITGVLGGFTTFSAYALETAGMIETEPTLALLYLTSTVVLGVLGVALGTRRSGAAT